MSKLHQNIGAIITAIGGILGTISVLYNSFNTNKKDTFSQIITELRSEIKQKEQDAEIYHDKWIKAEQDNTRLRGIIEKLRNKIDKLKREVKNDHK